MSSAKHRQKLKKLFEEENKLMNIFLDRKALIKGGIYKGKTKCGNKNCKCEREGELHEVWRYYRSENGKISNRTIKEGELIKLEKGTNNYKRFRKARMRLVKIHQEKLKIIDVLEKSKIKGEK